jgi:hypothetical protein
MNALHWVEHEYIFAREIYKGTNNFWNYMHELILKTEMNVKNICDDLLLVQGVDG